VSAADVCLRRFSAEDLPTVEPWFLDADTRRFLGGPAWSAIITEVIEVPSGAIAFAVKPDNVASRRSLDAAGFRLRSDWPDFEGMLYYRAWRSARSAGASRSA
jgi:hypothetical protein